MTDVKTLLAEIEAGLEGVTPGEWRTHLVDDTSVVAPNGTTVATTCDSSEAEREDSYNVEYERMEVDARHIARMNPVNVTAILDHIKALEAENAKLREALAWYGEQARLARLIHSEGDAGRAALSRDGGDRARDALGGDNG